MNWIAHLSSPLTVQLFSWIGQCKFQVQASWMSSHPCQQCRAQILWHCHSGYAGGHLWLLGSKSHFQNLFSFSDIDFSVCCSAALYSRAYTYQYLAVVFWTVSKAALDSCNYHRNINNHVVLITAIHLQLKTWEKMELWPQHLGSNCTHKGKESLEYLILWSCSKFPTAQLHFDASTTVIVWGCNRGS